MAKYFTLADSSCDRYFDAIDSGRGAREPSDIVLALQVRNT